jgi:hypothetical protein
VLAPELAPLSAKFGASHVLFASGAFNSGLNMLRVRLGVNLKSKHHITLAYQGVYCVAVDSVLALFQRDEHISQLSWKTHHLHGLRVSRRVLT